VNVKKPSEELNEDAKLKLPQPKKEINQNDSSKVDIDLNESVDENHKSSRFASLGASKDDIGLKKPERMDRSSNMTDEKKN
jgi:hypothetical protein